MANKSALPPYVIAAQMQLRAAAKRAGLSVADVCRVTPNQALMWEMTEEVTRLRKLLDRLAPGWNDEL